MYVRAFAKVTIISLFTIMVQTCLKLLSDKFHDSPRVNALQGIKLEATEGLDNALKYYENVLQEDPINVVRHDYCSVLPILTSISGCLETANISLTPLGEDRPCN
jgi:hypothetical protein